MMKLQIISKLWSAIYDLIFLVKGTPTKTLEEIEADLDIVEYACRKYMDCDDDEITLERKEVKENEHERILRDLRKYPACRPYVYTDHADSD